MKVDKVGKSVKMNLTAFLENKPLWAFWLVYSAFSGLLFGIFYTAMYLMAQQWWIPVVVIIAVGMIWGSVAFSSDNYEAKTDKDHKKEAKS